MADKKKVEKKVDEKSEVKSVKKSSYSKKKKVKKNIVNGIAYVQSTFNNTIVSIADTILKVMLYPGRLLDKKVLKVLENQHLMQHK